MIAPDRDTPVTIIGAGPTGSLLAVLLSRRGFRIAMYDSRADPRAAAAASGRSINLALADRGIHALESAGVFSALVTELMPMRGRFVHGQDGTAALQPYGRRPSEVIYSISRHRLNQSLVEAAADAGVELNFGHRLIDLDTQAGIAQVRNNAGALLSVPMKPLLAADGAGSTVRRILRTRAIVESDESDLEHAYKELTIPARPGGHPALAADALHIWPRGNFMLIALPNTDATFTATLFLPKHGAVSFDSLDSPEAAAQFIRGQFPDAYPLMPDCESDFGANPLGFLGTVHAAPWHAGGNALLIGDAAHAIVPFHGQGMNCCFEDCIEFDDCIAEETSWEAAFRRFFAQRKPNTDAIAAMAIENYREMRERVADPGFRLQQALALELERRHPSRFIPRYSMVMFHHEIPYRSALDRGAIQSRLLARLTAHAATLDQVDYELAGREIERELPPVA